MDTLWIKRFTDNAILPTRAYPTDAGLDLYSPYDAYIWQQDMVKIDIGIGIALSKGTVGLILDRSSIASKGIRTLGGVIDASYRGSISVILANVSSNENYEIKRGDKIAQLIITTAYTPQVMEVDDFEITDRGVNGFGSSGR